MMPSLTAPSAPLPPQIQWVGSFEWMCPEDRSREKLQAAVCAVYEQTLRGEPATFKIWGVVVDESMFSETMDALVQGRERGVNMRKIDVFFHPVWENNHAAPLIESIASEFREQLEVFRAVGWPSAAPVAVISKCTNLRVLEYHTDQREINDDEQMASFVRGMQACSQLEVVSIRETRGDIMFANELARAFACSPPCWPSLMGLDLHANKMSELAVTILGASLPSCANLVSLDVANNQFKVDGSLALALGIIQCKRLETLYIGHLLSRGTIHVGLQAVEVILDTMRQTPRLFSIYCAGCHPPGARPQMQKREARVAQRVTNDMQPRRRVQWVQMGLGERTKAPVKRFLERDGDHAVMTRVLLMLLSSPPLFV